jgi:hypothetical protein
MNDEMHTICGYSNEIGELNRLQLAKLVILRARLKHSLDANLDVELVQTWWDKVERYIDANKDCWLSSVELVEQGAFLQEELYHCAFWNDMRTPNHHNT